MEKRELSSTLRNLKFMQRAAQKEEKTKKVVVDQEVIESSVTRKCIVILEGDPHPGGSMKGRMSFQNFNPSIDKLNEEPTEVAVNSTSVNQSGKTSSDHHKNSIDENIGGSNELEKRVTQQPPNGELKRKQIEGGEVSETQHPNKSPKIDQQHSSQKNQSSSSSSSKKKREKLDWNLLKPPSKRTN